MMTMSARMYVCMYAWVTVGVEAQKVKEEEVQDADR